MRRLLFMVAALALAWSSAEAQTHPCDTAPPGGIVSVPQNTPLKIQFCSPATDNVDAAVAYVDAGPASSLQPVTALGAKSTASGLVLYETPLFLSIANRGNHTVQLSAYNRNASGVAQEGTKSAPFAFAVASEYPLTLSVTSDKASPQVKGSVVTFTATAAGGIAPYAYKWLLNGAVWRPWSSTNVQVWDTSTATPGTYTVDVWSRSSDITTDTAEATQTFTYVVTAPVVPPPVAPVIRGLLK